MALQKGAFDAEAYSSKFGAALGDIAGFNAVDQAGGIDTDQAPDQSGDYDQDQEQNVQRMNVNNPGASPMPSPFQQQRQMSTVSPPKGSNFGGPKGGAPQSSSAFTDPNGPHLSPPVYDSVDNMSDAQVRAYERHMDEHVASGKDQHGVPNLQEMHDRTFGDELKKRVDAAGLDEQTADKVMKPTWRDRVSMLLDATNRASAIHAQNPAMSKGDIWSVAVRGAMDGWMSHAQGQHDAYMQQQSAFRDQAEREAQESVKRSTDQFGLQQKADALLLNQRKQDETERHNKEAEKNAAAKAKSDAAKGAREAKGDLVTLDDGTLARIGAGGEYTPVKDKQGQPVKGTKTGADKTKSEDTAANKAAEAALKDAQSQVDKEEAAKAKDPMNFGKAPMAANERAGRAKEILRTLNPKAYKTLYPDEDIGAPAQMAAKSGADDDLPPSLRKKK